MGTSKWRESIVDPKELPLSKEITLISIDGYPHAGNDVFECTGSLNGKTVKFYLKVSRQLGADIKNEIEILKILENLNLPVPKVIYSNTEFEYPYVITLKVHGERLSAILNTKQNNIKESMSYMSSFGASLSEIHQLDINWSNVKRRRFHDVPKKEYFQKHRLVEVYDWLKSNVPLQKDLCFVHGDFHYANLLWHNGKISAVLDWELCGIGWKEFDIAWACILRPSQHFMKTTAEQETFLEGYSIHNTYNEDALNYCKVLIYSHFYGIGESINDDEYIENVIREIKKVVSF